MVFSIGQLVFLIFLEILCPSNACLFLIWFYFLCFGRAVSKLAASPLYLQSPRPFPVLATVSPVAGLTACSKGAIAPLRCRHFHHCSALWRVAGGSRSAGSHAARLSTCAICRPLNDSEWRQLMNLSKGLFAMYDAFTPLVLYRSAPPSVLPTCGEVLA